jgi:hypothetical protein
MLREELLHPDVAMQDRYSRTADFDNSARRDAHPTNIGDSTLKQGGVIGVMFPNANVHGRTAQARTISGPVKSPQWIKAWAPSRIKSCTACLVSKSWS